MLAQATRTADGDRNADIAAVVERLACITTPERSQLLLRIADLYIAGAGNLDDDAIAAFDTIMLSQIAISDHAAVVALSRKLAPLANPPPTLLAAFAGNADIAIAGPALSHSPYFSTAELIRFAAMNGQAHLHALCSRAEIPEPLARVLIDRGGPSVLNRLLMTSAAHYDAADFGWLLKRAIADERGRVMTDQRAGIATAPDRLACDARVVNISMSGAGIIPDAFDSLPESFTIILYAVERRRVPCRLVWKSAFGLGVAFETNPFAD
jgi:uncharacterized protein (DUF2336 family)